MTMNAFSDDKEYSIFISSVWWHNEIDIHITFIIGQSTSVCSVLHMINSFTSTQFIRMQPIDIFYCMIQSLHVTFFSFLALYFRLYLLKKKLTNGFSITRPCKTNFVAFFLQQNMKEIFWIVTILSATNL